MGRPKGGLNPDSGMPASTKQDKRYHGFGLKSIQATAAKYGGSMATGSQDGWFELRILFPLSEGKSEEVPHGDHQ